MMTPASSQKEKAASYDRQQKTNDRHTPFFLCSLIQHSRNTAKPRIPSAISLVELSINTRISCSGIDADALLVWSESELAGAGLTADEIVVGFGDGFGLGDCGAGDGGDEEEEDGEEFHFWGFGEGLKVWVMEGRVECFEVK